VVVNHCISLCGHAMANGSRIRSQFECSVRLTKRFPSARFSTYPPCSIGVSSPEGIVHIGPRIPPSSSERGVVGKCTLVRRRQ
jgi:hypothetical protein